ncbi:MAG: hypothetical protein U0Z75_06870 [Deinococcaceae bacterium]
MIKIVGILGVTVVLMAMGNVKAEDQTTTTAMTLQQIALPIPGIPGGGGTTANGGGPGSGSGSNADTCSNC